MNTVNPNDFFADLSSLGQLKNQAKKDPDAALKQVAQEFESLFINMLLKNMRKSNELISGGEGLFSSSESRFYQEMMDTQMAQTLAKSGGIGLSEALIRQLQGGVKSQAKDSEGETELATHELARVQMLARQAAKDILSKESIQSSAEKVTTPGMPVENAVFQTPEAFVETLWPLAKQAGETLGVNPQAILAQAALETGWGRYPIAKEDGTASFNLFGIKADNRWQGERAVVTTLEYVDGVAKKQKAPFRAYDSFSHSFQDYADFISSSDRYKDAVLAGDDAAMFAAYLQKGGYATDPNYSDKIQNILSSKWFRTLM